MHLITLSTVRRLISGVDITPSIIRQEFFFSFHYKPYNLCTSHYNQPFKTIPFSCVYLIIPFHFQIFFHLITPKHYSEKSHQVCISHIHLLFCEFQGGGFPHSIAKFSLQGTHLRMAPPTAGLPCSSAGWGKALGSPGFSQDSANSSPSDTHAPSKLTSLLAHWRVRGDGR